jgi:hypothetical protein
MSELFLALLKGLLGKIVTDEFGAGCQSFAQWLVKQSAGRLISDRDRYLEQWLADLKDRKTPLRKLLFAFGIVRASTVLRHQPASARPAVRRPLCDAPTRNLAGIETDEDWERLTAEVLSLIDEGHTVRVIASDERQEVGVDHNADIVFKMHDPSNPAKHRQVLVQLKFRRRSE